MKAEPAHGEVLLQVQNISKCFGGLQALAEISFDLPRGQILGLIGPNGAGKTTLFNVINGVYPPDQGRIKLDGIDITGWAPYNVVRLGLARTHQIVRPLNDLTVLENVVAGACFGRQRLSLSQAATVAEEVLSFVGLAARRDALAASLNVAQKKRLELARALAARPSLLLLDEVLAGLNTTEITEMIGVVRQIRDQGVTILIIEHVMQALMNLSDWVIVLDYGRMIATGAPDQVANDPRVIEAYLGDAGLAEQLLGAEP